MNLYNYCKSEGIKIDVACEVGFYRLEDSQIKEFIENGRTCIIVDIRIQKDFILKYLNVFCYQNGIGYAPSKSVRFIDKGASTYMTGIHSPFVANQKSTINEQDLFVELKTFDTIDTGIIDIISIDIEGMEWAVLCNMKSLPKIIEVEMKWKKYINPYYDTIKHWMKINGYIFLERDGSDFIYRRTT